MKNSVWSTDATSHHQRWWPIDQSEAKHWLAVNLYTYLFDTRVKTKGIPKGNKKHYFICNINIYLWHSPISSSNRYVSSLICAPVIVTKQQQQQHIYSLPIYNLRLKYYYYFPSRSLSLSYNYILRFFFYIFFFLLTLRISVAPCRITDCCCAITRVCYYYIFLFCWNILCAVLMLCSSIAKRHSHDNDILCVSAIFDPLIPTRNTTHTHKRLASWAKSNPCSFWRVYDD